jgi:DNA-binding SARP family transcriptional activator
VLEISLLGDFYLALDGQPLNDLVSGKGRALLAYLVIEAGRPHPRSALAVLLWPSQPETDSRANLRQTLHRLCQVLGTPSQGLSYLLITHQEIRFNPYSNCRLDIAELNQLLNTCQGHHRPGLLICEDCLENLQAAAHLYRGD